MAERDELDQLIEDARGLGIQADRRMAPDTIRARIDEALAAKDEGGEGEDVSAAPETSSDRGGEIAPEPKESGGGEKKEPQKTSQGGGDLPSTVYNPGAARVRIGVMTVPGHGAAPVPAGLNDRDAARILHAFRLGILQAR